MGESSIALMLRSRASSAFTRVFDALWCGVSKHEAALILRDPAYAHRVTSFSAAPQDEGGANIHVGRD
jgi:hypothetical protein